tara:strand:- start:37437 stop:38030 length:594 start_codon:yes stop_codon:yes gene_type:complete
MANSNKTNFSSPEFLNKLKDRDHDAVESLVKTYSSHLVNASFGLGLNESDAQELVQNVWGTFFQNIQNFEGRSHIRTYLFGILYNKAKELYRERNKHTSDIDLNTYFEDKFDDTGHWALTPKKPEEFIESIQTSGIIESCLNKLPEKQRMAFYLKEVDGASTEEVCNVLKVSATNLRVILFRTKAKLRDCVERKMQA